MPGIGGRGPVWVDEEYPLGERLTESLHLGSLLLPTGVNGVVSDRITMCILLSIDDVNVD